ncbi:MAG TPA: phosphatase PAP2 family protein [Streptosporangiaceae bacterium]|jgi:membrane-associated phospholipid phosphatase
MDSDEPLKLARERDVTPPGTDPAPAAGAAPDPPPATETARVAARPRRAACVCIAAGLLFGLLALWIARRGAAVPAVDTTIHSWALSHRGPDSVAVASAVRWGGVTTVVLPALIVIGAVTASARTLGGRLRSGLLLCLVASAGVYAEILINHGIDRRRPPVADWAGAASGAAFPSGHTTAATLFALSCASVIAARLPAGWPRRSVWAGAVAYAAVVGWSRVWLGVHWPADVAGGWLFSVAWCAGAVAVIGILRRPAGALRDRLRRTPA